MFDRTSVELNAVITKLINSFNKEHLPRYLGGCVSACGLEIYGKNKLEIGANDENRTRTISLGS